MQKLALCAAAFIVITLVIFLRFFELGQIPHGINVDEASYGYDAYSILKTGKDMWGQVGVSLKSFGDYKPAGLSYTLIPVIQFFGLSTFATRLPSAVFGLLTLVVTFFILKLLFGSALTASLGTLILSLTPWHFGLSRLFYEPNSGLFFLACSIFLELKYLRQPTKTKYLVLASILTALGGYYYSVLRYLGVGLLGLVVVLVHTPHLRRLYKFGFIALFFWMLFALPYLGDMFGSTGFIRLRQESSLHEFGDTLVITENREMCYLSSGHNPLTARLCYALWNKPGEMLVNTAKVYLQLLGPKYLFLNSYQKDVLPENYGAFLEILAPFYFLGIFYLFTHLSQKKEYLYLLSSWLFAAIPISLAGALNIHRNVLGLYFVFLICIYGLFFTGRLIAKIPQKIISFIVIGIIALACLWSQARYLGEYYAVYTKMQPEIWLYDTPEVMNWLKLNARGREINFYNYDFAPLYYAFYTRLNPQLFQQSAVWTKPNSSGWMHPREITGLVSEQSNYLRAVCAHLEPATPSKLLVIEPRPELKNLAETEFRNFTGVHLIHQIYDSQKVYNYLKSASPLELRAKCLTLSP